MIANLNSDAAHSGCRAPGSGRIALPGTGFRLRLTIRENATSIHGTRTGQYVPTNRLGEHPAGDRYPLPFHPLELGGDVALRAFFGFSIEGRRQPTDIDADSVKLAGFRFPPARPVTKEKLAEFTRIHKRTTYRMGADGKLIQVEA